jgi:hypothetical protein
VTRLGKILEEVLRHWQGEATTKKRLALNFVTINEGPEAFVPTAGMAHQLRVPLPVDNVTVKTEVI